MRSIFLQVGTWHSCVAGRGSAALPPTLVDKLASLLNLAAQIGGHDLVVQGDKLYARQRVRGFLACLALICEAG